VNAVLLVGGVIVLVLLGASPANVDDPTVGNGIFFVVAVNLGFVAICFMKGKLGTGVIGSVTPFVALVGSVRMARPHSAWAKRRYPEGSRKLERATARDARFDVRWRSKVRAFQDKVAGFGA
jgi:lysyl-tRNA synthetase class 2